MGKTKKCCVKGCEAVGQTVHRFPNPRKDMDLFDRWLAILCIEELYSLPPEKVYDNKRVCFAHFESTCKSPGNPALHRYAVPTIGVPVVQSSVAEEPLASSKEISTPVTVCSEVAKLSTPAVAVCDNKVTDEQQASEEQQDNPESDNCDKATVEELTTEHVSEIIAMVRKVSNYVREVDPNVARSLTFRRTINNAMSCYRKIYVTKQVKKK